MKTIARVFLASSFFLSACAVEEEPPPDSTWEVAYEVEDAALLSVWGSSPDDVWAAGGSGDSGLILHKTGDTWEPVMTDADQTLWWIYGFRDDDIYAVGEGGLILHYNGSDWSRLESGTDATLYGVWGLSSEDVWVVGGDPTGAAGSAVVLRGHQGTFEVVEDIAPEMLPGALFKIYGSPQGVVAVGSGGSIVEYDGASWQRVQAPTSESIFSLWGRSPGDVYAVGGLSANQVLHYDGSAWSKVIEAGGYGLSGVFTAPEQPTIAVGHSTTIIEFSVDGSQLSPLVPALPSMPSLHGVWGDGSRTAYSVGGNLRSYGALDGGVILQRY